MQRALSSRLLHNAAELQPDQIQKKLGEWIVGQQDAKRSVAVAMRNRWRRRHVPENLRREIIPKNILMIGGSGTGKTEIARRMAELSGAPFIKVEATKFTEVGYKGADVDSIIKDLLEIAVKLVSQREEEKNSEHIKKVTEDVLLDTLLGSQVDQKTSHVREEIRNCLRFNVLDDIEVPYEVKPTKEGSKKQQQQITSNNSSVLINMADLVNFMSPKSKKNKYTIAEVRAHEEAFQREQLMNKQKIIQDAIHETEEFGIVFIDEIDKIAKTRRNPNSDASDEGVQRDLLPLIEGCKITTDKGDVDTSKILFIAAGAFHQVKPSDLLPELQGRLPIRVVLNELTADDLYRILTEPTAHLIRQQKALMLTEGVDLRITDEAIREVANVALEMNKKVENIGARRLHTVLESLFEDISFNAANFKGKTLVYDKPDVESVLKKIGAKSPDLKQYIL
jgi:ATP-dependent HslUV protease ATP-binding subunit HslU